MSLFKLKTGEAGFVEPMLCGLYRPSKHVITPGEWVVEEKFDGHRLIVRVQQDQLFAWSRYGEARPLPRHLGEQLLLLPSGVYDGELLVPGGDSSVVKALGFENDLVFTIFDFLECDGLDATGRHWHLRRELLETAVLNTAKRNPGFLTAVSLSEVTKVNCSDDVDLACANVWARGGEGLIIKRTTSIYRPGKRSQEWLKLKQILSKVLTIKGYRPGVMGPQSTVVLEDDEGFVTTVKTLNTQERERLEADPRKFLGRRLVIEYQERTADGNYRHPRWDRWAEDHE